MKSRGPLIVGTAAAVAAVILVAGWAVQDPKVEGASASSAATATPSPIPIEPRLTSTIDYPNVGAHFNPPDIGEVPVTTAEAALVLYRRQGSPPELEQQARPVIRLVKLSHDSYGGDAPNGGPAPSPYDNVLAWDVSFSGYSGVPAGGLKPDGTAMTPSTYRCDFHYLVDARTGSELVSWEECRP